MRTAQTTYANTFAGNDAVRSDIAKRAFDMVAASLILLVASPVLAAIWLTIRLTSQGPVLFVQERLGRGGARFGAFKFRTMVVDAEARLDALLAADPQAAEEYRVYKKLRRDPRVTAVGTVLRRLSLDELPQLLNVLRGEMSLVGPRCYLPRELPEMGAAAHEILSVTPGITGLWQVSGRNGTTFAERVRIDVGYARSATLALDLKILAKTVRVVATGHGAC
ncbi:lipopolysaccharide/colanic/teichoic acid biosynthesis glycosyltransferase [Constrictibacter sp. MBR-5]|jgi:lipopolysaccharide/colanic/teichoic acid biosynthesis glycosyltransferase|uniref:sugar transferase n=1 Tax=Constrictibacter sp. MBR-5 TaxID=3156467 RepID=UPI003393CC56